uniref:Uncharacterized protein n=1 Tax=Anguilla anguilla TaxID=7936 RepID=A0A0E9W2F5_ANGAN
MKSEGIAMPLRRGNRTPS